MGLDGAAVRSLRQGGTAVSPYEPTKALVESGPYRFTRNPIYLGFSLVVVGGATLANAAWPLLGLAAVTPVVRGGVVAREEAYLARRLGAPYEAYRGRVRRWV